MRHETATRSQSVRLELSLATRRTLHMQWFQLGFALDDLKSKGFSFRHATQALLHDRAHRDFIHKIASKHLKAKTCRKTQRNTNAFFFASSTYTAFVHLRLHPCPLCRGGMGEAL